MLKVVPPNSFDFGTPAAQLVDVHSRGVDRSWRVKRAALLTDEITRLRPVPGHAYIHLISMGAMESYGCNRNGDGFNEKAATFELPNPKPGTPKLIKLAGGLMEYHPTFTKLGYVYKNHQNTDPAKAIGHIYAQAYNPEMRRGELIIDVPLSKSARDAMKVIEHPWEEKVARLAEGKDIAFSMACFTAGTLIRTASGYKRIEDIRVDDHVLTHTGNLCRVTDTMKRRAPGRYRVALKGWGREVLEVTDEHPFFAVSFSDLPKQSHKGDSQRSKPFKKAHREELSSKLHWVEAKSLTKEHYLAVPIPRHGLGGFSYQLDPKLARLLGYFIGDGSLTSPNGDKYSTVSFTLDRTDQFMVDELKKLAPWTSTTTRLHPKSEQCTVLDCFSTQVAELLHGLSGQAEDKHVPSELFSADLNSKIEYLCGWFNTDGWQDTDGLHWSTSVRTRALDLQLLLASIGIPASCNRIDHPEDRGLVKSADAVEYVVNVSNRHSEWFAGKSKAVLMPLKTKAVLSVFISGNYLMVPVKSVEYVDGETDVYNFSVAGDDTYTVSLLAVHNCKVAYDICSNCGNRARHRGEYCECLRDHMSEITKTGHQNFAINDVPFLFDISDVFKPADRIAYSLRKVAAALDGVVGGAQLAEDMALTLPEHLLSAGHPLVAAKIAAAKKLAEIEKQVDAVASGRNNSHIKQLISGIAPHKIPTETLEVFKREKVGTVLSALAEAQILLQPEDFFQLVMGEKYASIAADVPAVPGALPGLYTRLLASGEAEECASDTAYDPSCTATPRHVKEAVWRLMSDHSQSPECAARRSMQSVVLGREYTLATASEKRAAASAPAGLLAKEYAKYQLAFAHAAAGNHLTQGLTVLQNYAS